MPLPDSLSLKPARNLTDIGLMLQRTPSEEFLPLHNKASAFTPGIAQGPAIYVVDDEPMLLELAAVILEPQGYRLQTFRDPEMALQTFGAAQPRTGDSMGPPCNPHPFRFAGKSDTEHCRMFPGRRTRRVKETDA